VTSEYDADKNEDGSLKANVFDPNAEFLIKYRQRRRDLEEQAGLRVVAEQ
jgi:hypothetical protein